MTSKDLIDTASNVAGGEPSQDAAVASSGQGAPRILARQLARPLTDEELDHISGAARARADTWCETCNPGTNDCGT